MRKKLILVMVLLALMVLAAYVWFLGRTPEREAQVTTPAPTEATSTESVSDEPVAGTGALRGVLGLNKNLECRVWQSKTIGDGVEEGSAFFSEGAMRGDFVTSVDGTTTVSSMIVKDSRMYVWSIIDGTGYGVEMDVQNNGATSTVAIHEPVTLDETVSYDCKRWGNIDKSIFTPPTTVLFRDMNTIIKQGMEYGETY